MVLDCAMNIKKKKKNLQAQVTEGPCPECTDSVHSGQGMARYGIANSNTELAIPYPAIPC